MNNKTRFYGIYNIGSTDVYLPDYIREKYGWTGERVPAHSLNIDSGKAKDLGLL